jgi:hypothetical protein
MVHSLKTSLLVGTWVILCTVALIHNSWPHYATRMHDFAVIARALEAYKAKHGLYPQVDDWVGYLDERHYAAGDWIPGLSPEFLSAVPIDPKGSMLPQQQYLYASNGADYKLIAHGAEDGPYVARRRAYKDDPRRTGYAYGIWTPGAVNW